MTTRKPRIFDVPLPSSSTLTNNGAGGRAELLAAVEIIRIGVPPPKAPDRKRVAAKIHHVVDEIASTSHEEAGRRIALFVALSQLLKTCEEQRWSITFKLPDGSEFPWLD